MEFIEIIGARENNLQNINLKIPKKQITIFTGVSGSGKSSVVFETIAQESSRLLNETFPAFVRNFMPKYSRPDVDEINNISPSIVIDQKRIGGNSRSTLGTVTDIDPLLRVMFSRIGKPYAGTAGAFSFNDTRGMCKTCEGIGKVVTLNLNEAVDMNKSLNEGAILLPGHGKGQWQWKLYANSGFFDLDKKLKDYSPEELEKLLYAAPEKLPAGKISADLDINLTYSGLVPRFENSNVKGGREKSEKSQKKMEKYTKIDKCKTCGGARYDTEILNCRIDGYNIAQLTSLQVDELVKVVKDIDAGDATPVAANLLRRLEDLINIGLDYVSLNRETATLSGGESQRVKMVKNLSSSLTDMLYIFDEPSIGLHPRDVHRLCDILIKLRDKGNTVIVVEHDPDIIKIADYVVDMGPKAGSHGGQIMYAGPYKGLQAADTLTSRHLDAPLSINPSPKSFSESFKTTPSNLNNLKNTSVSIPKGVFTVVTGVAGSGKSTLIHQVFAEQYPEAIVIDQGAVSANSRSNPATYTGIMDHIRQEFAAATGESASLFSFNSEGACEACHGLGYIEMDLSFMDAVKNICEDCGGKRFKREVLEMTVKGKSISDIMEMTILEALDFFESKDIKNKLKNIQEVGLSYLTLGQPLNTLSGGECQRIKLAKELNKKGNIYIMDEPTTGLHFSDITNILAIIAKLVKGGNTVVTIEHNLDIIRSADWIIDLGPGAGHHGGEILFAGEPKELKSCERSLTGKYL